MDNTEALQPVAAQLNIDIDNADFAAAKDALIQKINTLILHDFEKLVSMLYRIDVSEKKINILLQQFPKEDAASLIADLMIDREAEKIQSRKTFTRKNNAAGGEEKW